MRRTSFVLFGVAAASLSQAQVISVVPNAYSGTPGGSTFLGPLANAQRTYQLLINENQLTAHVGNRLTAMTFRIPPSAANPWPAANIQYGTYDIRLSESVAPANRSLTFANNVVGSQTLVRSGPLAISAGSFPSGGSPNAFGVDIGFQTPYLYSGGHLLIEIRHQGFTGTSTSVEAIAATGGPTGVYGQLVSACWTGNYTGTAGSQGNAAVVRLTSVPEPATMAALAGGFAALLARRRRRKA